MVLRSILFNISFFGAIILFSTGALLILPLPFRWRYQFITWWARYNIFSLHILCGLKVEVSGREHLPSRPVVFLSNHQSTWETASFQAILPPIAWVLKRELQWIPLFGWAMASMKPIAIDRSAGKEAMRQIIEQGQLRIQQGRSIIIFPQGTRTAPGAKRRYGLGGAVLATETSTPVVPIAHNAGLFWPRRGFLKKPGIIHMVIGPQIVTKGRKAEEVNKEVQDWIEGQLRSFSENE